MGYQLYDASKQETVRLSEDQLKEKLDQLKAIIDRTIARLKTVGGYELNTIKVTVGFEAGIFILTVKGGIELTYGIKKP